MDKTNRDFYSKTGYSCSCVMKHYSNLSPTPYTKNLRSDFKMSSDSEILISGLKEGILTSSGVSDCDDSNNFESMYTDIAFKTFDKNITGK